MKENSSQNFDQPRYFDIEEVTKSLEEDDETIVQVGEVKEWKRLEIEKAQTRSYITGIVIAAWVICIVIGIARLIAVGDVSLLLGSPILFIGPLNIVLKFYFKR